MSSPENPQFEPQQEPASGEPQTSSGHVPSSFPAAVDPDFAPTPLQPGGPVPPQRTPPEDPPWNGWDVTVIVGLTFVTIFILQVAILYGAHYLVYPRKSLAELAQRPLLLLISQFLIDGAVGLYIYLLVKAKYDTQFWRAIKWNWPNAAWRMLGLGALMLLGLTMLENVLPMPKEVPFDKLFSRPRDAYLLVIIAVTLGPLVEELFFRGFFYPVLARRLGVWWGIFLSALPFALLHLQQYGYAWSAFLVIFIVGMVCGAVRAWAGSVGASFLVHAGYNGTQMLIALVWTRGFTHLPKGLLQLYLR